MYKTFTEIENERKIYMIKCVEKLKREQKIDLQKFSEALTRYYSKLEKLNNYKQANKQEKEKPKHEISEGISVQILNNVQPREENTLTVPKNFQSGTELFKIQNEELLTNIPFSQSLIDKFIAGYSNQRELDLDYNAKRFINKRITQVSFDANQITRIANELKQYTKSFGNIVQINLKIIEQGKLQVSTHRESYKSYAYLLDCISDDKLHADFRFRVMTVKHIETRHLTGVYLIFFGFLKLRKLFDEAWFVLASILNVEPSSGSLYVIEAFIYVLGKNMHDFYGSELQKIQNYLEHEYFLTVDNEPIKVRINHLIRTNIE